MSKVYLIGAGPGNPDLITRRAARLLRRADCVIYDRLVNCELLKELSSRCEQIYAGKDADEGGREQTKILRLLVKKGRRHRIVVRLQGGDPAVFGRMSEELAALREAGIPCEIVPGVSSAWAAAAALGIPLTDRQRSSSVAFVTGHEAGRKQSAIRWRELARGADTLVILMGWASLRQIVRRLRKAGRPGRTPIALVRWISMPQEAVVLSRLDQVEKEVKRHAGFGPPLVMMVGTVVADANWASLQGRKILITRPKSDAAEITRRLEERGATCLHLPAIQVKPKRLSRGQAQELFRRLPRFNWLLFNSHHGVEALGCWARQAGVPLRQAVRGEICAIGPRTEAALRSAGLKADLKPRESSVKGVKEAFRNIPLRGKSLLIPRSNLGVGDDLAGTLRKRGARVEEITAYETRPIRIAASRLRRAIQAADAVTFTSASTAESFLKAIRRARLPLPKVLNGTSAVAIGPSTAKVLRKAGVHRLVLPDKNWTLDGLVSAVGKAVGR